MNLVLIDSSIWIQYFKGADNNICNRLENLVDVNQLCINDLILSELLPHLYLKRQKEAAKLLNTIKKININIDWNEMVNMQLTNLRNGINSVGIPDLIIIQNVIQNNLILYSNDKHFKLMSKYFKIKLF